MSRFARAMAALCILIFAAAAFSAERTTAIIDPSQAGEDFNIQGEYIGDSPSGKIGAQVIALGKGTFHAVLLPGGLPGEGWDGKTRMPLDGKLDQGQTTLNGSGYRLTISGGVLSGEDPQGGKLSLKRIVRQSPTLGAKPPQNAIIIFDGSRTDELERAKVDGRKLLAAGTSTNRKFKDFTMHLEFILPFMPDARGQARANSGVYIQRRYEVQILDSFGLEGKENECGALYRQVAPRVNMCYPPLQWQTYDIDFTAARFDPAGKKIQDAVITLRQNGVLIHDRQKIRNKTGNGQPESPEPQSINFQDHGNPVFFRNIWVVEK